MDNYGNRNANKNPKSASRPVGSIIFNIHKNPTRPQTKTHNSYETDWKKTFSSSVMKLLRNKRVKF